MRQGWVEDKILREVTADVPKVKWWARCPSESADFGLIIIQKVQFFFADRFYLVPPTKLRCWHASELSRDCLRNPSDHWEEKQQEIGLTIKALTFKNVGCVDWMYNSTLYMINCAIASNCVSGENISWSTPAWWGLPSPLWPHVALL